MTGSPKSDRGDLWQQGRRTGGGTARGAERRPARWLAVGYAGLAVLCLTLGALAFVLIAPPLGPVRERLADEVKARTGRTLVVSGPMSARLFPRVVVSMGDVAVLPPDGVEGAPTVTVPSLEVGMSLRSLLSRRPRFDHVTLHGPTVELAIDAQGRRSWELAASRSRPRRLPAAEAGGAQGDLPGLQDRLHKIEGITSVTSGQPRPWALRIVDGSVRYRDDRTGAHHEIRGLNLDLAAEDRNGPVAVSGSAGWQGGPWRFSGTAAYEILEGRPGLVSLKLAGAPLEAAYEGMLAVRGGFAAEGSLSLGPFVYKGTKIGRSSLQVVMDAGVAKATLQQIELYGGAGQGSLTFDATGQTPAFTASVKLSGVSLLPLLGDAGGIRWIDGRGSVAVDLTGQGRTEEQIVETLQGKVQVAVADGAVTGIDIDRSLRALQRGRLDRLGPRREDRTPFSELSGTFDIANGIARNQDLKLVSAHLQLSGEGTVELAPRRLDYTLQTKIAGGPPDDGAAVRIGTIELPIIIKGPLDRPEFTIKGQEGLTDTIRQIGRNLRSRDVQDAIKGFLGGNGEKHVKPSELIEKLLKKE
jgi:uncharacterized protein involved in outer membrane biogenesis